VTRSGSDIGAGLAPVRPARPVRPGERIHVVGAAGAGASAAALLAGGAGAIVDGCDPGGSSPYTPALDAAGIPVAWGHDPAHVTTPPSPDRLAVTKALTAIAPDHPELVAARQLGIPVEPWQQLIADLAVGRRLVAVAGTHGKSTTAGWLTHVLVAAGADPSAFVGALLPASLTAGVPATARLGAGAAFVVEADEYAGNFDAFRPSIVVLTNVDWDHPDVFADRGAAVAAFAEWLTADRVGSAPTLIANVSDPGVVELLARLEPWRARIVTTELLGEGGTGKGTRRSPGGGQTLQARVLGAGPSGTTIAIDGLRSGRWAEVRLPTAGRHNVANALGVVGAATELGLGAGAVVAGLESFPGVGRRLERKGEAGGVVVYDDYAHHPTAIRETIAAIRQREPGRFLWAVYEPLTFHRTAVLLDDFAAVLATADGVGVADIWAGRDRDVTVASATKLAAEVRQRRPDIVAAAPGSVEATADWLARRVQPGDAVLVMGGGRSYRIGELLLEGLGRRSAP
jgi:UDP-N-acetylmuramate--alanine ligase